MAVTLTHCLDFDHAVKVSLMGESHAGKSCLMERWTQNTYSGDNKAGTFGVDFSQRVVQVGDELVKTRVWDASGRPTHRKFFTPFYKRSNGVVLVYDLTSRDSLDKLSVWVRDVVPSTSPSAVLMLVGCKADLEDQRQVSRADARAFCDAHGVRMLTEVSAATGANVDEAFNMLLMRIQQHLLEHSSDAGSTSGHGAGQGPVQELEMVDDPRLKAAPGQVTAHAHGNNEARCGSFCGVCECAVQ